MKLHVDLESDAKLNISRLREMTCEEAAPAFVKGLAKELNKGHGYDSMFYKGCLKFVQRNANASIPVISQIEKFGTVCKQGRFVENETVLAKVDPTRLAAECDRVVYNMDVQFRLLGGRSLSTPEGFCAVMIDMVMPIDQEPECMRLLEDIVHAHFEFIGTKHFWPDIIHENHFDQAFMTACLEDKKLSTEAKGRDAEFGVGADECKLSLEKLMAVDLSNATKMPVFLADVCPLIGKPLPALSEPPKPTYVSTTRALTAAMFQRVYFFGHAEEKLAPYVKLQLQRLQSSSAAPESLELSPDHYVHVCLESGTCELTKAKTMYASDVTVGNHVWLCTLDVGSCELGEVISTSMVPRMGLYNPFTLSGNIVVNGVLASAHSSWFLDGLFSAKLRGFLPSIYQTILLPGRCLYGIFGSRAADWLGVNNPQWAQGLWLQVCVSFQNQAAKERVRSFDGQVLCMSGAYRNENQSCLLGMSRPSQEIWLLRCYRRYKSVFRIYFGVSQPSGKAFKG
ncbi:Sonic hedgehog protein [Durusdinium trenchii]|uniref:Sonic hedgehog protein n=1 Tax=Durusdinium trenchii TaxID=1381693 RepID=A0ABP0KQ57_9DINO